MEKEKDEKVNKIQNAVMNSLAKIYQKAEEIEKVDKERADWIVKKVEDIRKDIADNHTQPVEFLSEIMLIQTEIMNFLDSDTYKQKSKKPENTAIDEALATIGKQTISEEDKAALLHNQNEGTETKQTAEQSPNNENEAGKWMQIYVPHKKHFWQKIIEKIVGFFHRKQEVY